MKIQIFRNFLFLGLFMLCSYGYAQDITGNVSGVNDLPLPGVSVIVKNTTHGAASDFDGDFTISGVEIGETLVFSFMGFITQEIVVKDFNALNVIMQEDLQSLDEVVVVGYGTMKKELITGSSVNKTGAEITALNTPSAMEALQGTTAGVNITRDNGAPGAGTKVTIRGIGTIGNAEPLYIVDGIAVGNIDYLNPTDIQSIDVLKDAASAAIYGSRAANGVVLVTTVKGRAGSQAKITFSTYYGFQNIYKNLDPLNAQEYMYIMDEGRVNDGLAPTNWEAAIKNNAWLSTNYPQAAEQYGQEIWDNLQNGWEGTNWIDEMTTADAPVSNYALNITGGSEDAVYALGVSYFDQKGIIGGDIIDAGYSRLTLRLNTEFVLRKNEEHNIITVGQNMTYTNSENRSVATGNIYYNDLHNALVQNPLMPAYWQGSIDYNIDPYGFAPTLEGVGGNQHDPLAVMYYRSNFNDNKNNTIVGNVYLEIEPILDLKIRSSFGINTWFGNNRSMSSTYNLGRLYSNSTNGATQSQYFGNTWTWTNTATYERQFGDHQITGLIGTELLQNQINNEVGGSKANLLFPGQMEYAYLQNTENPASISDINTWGADWAAGGGGLMSYMARAQYNYKEKYLFSAIVRVDGSSNFAEGNRWGTFPSFSGGWILSEEDFMDNTRDYLDFVKLRASWGQNGNQSIDNFIYSSQIAYVFPGYFFGDTKPVSGTTAYPAKVPNPDVTWETSEQLDFGFDVRMFDSRLALTFDWYKKTTKDWLLEAPILGTSGAGAPYINGGDIENEGVEVVVSWSDEINDFQYGVTLTGASNKNEVTRIANTDGSIIGASSILSQGTSYISRVEVGQPIGYFYGYKTDGILQNQQEVDAYVTPSGDPYFSDQRPGDVRFVDLNQDGVIDEGDKTYLGNPNPDLELGFQLNVGYKGFYANTTLAGKFGMQVMQSYRSFADNFTQNYTTSIFDRWHGEGTSNTLPRLTSGSNRNTNYISDIFMHDADYLRINNLTVGFEFPESMLPANVFSKLNIYMAVTNLHTFTNYDGMDPDVSYGGNDDTTWASGVDLGLYPQARTVIWGLTAQF
ncbi:TonB-dependent receptor [Formosa sp. PL04]|uniref:SusC/RagA family TonB-linked outer membrane protein n=1 Tax=Formosa sp. PL04 TaxID=3081755 RepID=UPI0029812263|nr:TonB-dependent receptor [Formosa sp. PL04]MDW5287543.1 TonB-dependent receptor [Formosa sp. PL04]